MHAIRFYFSISFLKLNITVVLFLLSFHYIPLNSPLSRITATLRTEKERPVVAELYRATIWLSRNGFSELQVDVLKIKSEKHLVYCLFFFLKTIPFVNL